MAKTEGRASTCGPSTTAITSEALSSVATLQAPGDDTDPTKARHGHGCEVVKNRAELVLDLTPAAAAAAEWRKSAGLVPYEAALAGMDARAAAIAQGTGAELIWLLEHAPLYTAGTSAAAGDVIASRFPVHTTGRGGQVTYHGPGQRVVYLMLDLRRRGPDVRRYVASLEEWIIRTLSDFGIRGERREDRVGVWVRRPDKGVGCEDKIAALGIRVRRWVTLHGISLNVDPDLGHFSGIVPCGVVDPRYGVTSLADLGVAATMEGVDAVLRREFEAVFGATRDEAASPGPTAAELARRSGTAR
jgi:lipoyl(octanoyl) transferase